MSGGDHLITELDGVQRCHWAQIRARLRAELGEELYNSWLSRLELRGVDDGEATLIAPTNFMKKWINKHYLDRLEAEFQVEFGDISRVSMAVQASSAG